MRNLKRRHQGWYARVAVPKHLCAALGRTDFVRSLHTRDLTTAKRKLHAALADIQREIAAAEATREFPPESIDYVLSTAQAARDSVAKGLNSTGAAQLALDAAVEKHLDIMRAEHGVDAEGDPLVDDGHVRAIRLAHRVFAGEAVTLLSAQAEAHLDEIAGTIRKQTLADKRKALQALRDWLGSDLEVAAITRRVAGRYLTDSLMKRGRSLKTTKTELSHVSSCWNWMMGRGVIDLNPWLRMSLPKDKRGREAPRRAWTDAEVITLLNGTPSADPLWTLSALAMYTGARIEELCSLKVADIDGGALRIREGKTEAAVRVVPIHAAIAPLVRRLMDASGGTYLIPGLLTGGRDARRSAGTSKRFGWHLRHHLKITDPALTFHSLRHSFLTRCELAGVPEPTAKLLVGHSRAGSLTYSAAGRGYSTGLPLVELTRAVARITYGEADALVRRMGSKVKITRRSVRRLTRHTPNKETP